MKKIVLNSLLLVFLAVSCFATVSANTVLADSGQDVYFTYTNYSHVGSVDGSDHGWFYTLTGGGASLEVTDTTATGDMYVTLKRVRPGIDLELTTKTINGTGKYWFNTDTYSSEYYIFAWGGSSGTEQLLSGWMHNHS